MFCLTLFWERGDIHTGRCSSCKHSCNRDTAVNGGHPPSWESYKPARPIGIARQGEVKCVVGKGQHAGPSGEGTVQRAITQRSNRQRLLVRSLHPPLTTSTAAAIDVVAVAPHITPAASRCCIAARVYTAPTRAMPTTRGTAQKNKAYVSLRCLQRSQHCAALSTGDGARSGQLLASATVTSTAPGSPSGPVKTPSAALQSSAGHWGGSLLHA